MTTPEQPLRIGVIGCGGFTAGKHLPNLAANPRFRIQALCDTNAATLAQLADRYQPAQVTGDYHAVCSNPQVDALLIGTKPSFRLPIMETAISHRKPMFVEKPMSLDADETVRMFDLVTRSGIPFMVGHNRPYSPLMRDVKELFLKARDRSRTIGNNTLITYRINGEAQLWPQHHYRAVVEQNESTIIHELTHIFDLLDWMVDAEPVRVSAAGGGNMDNVVTVGYDHGITAVIISGDNGSAGFPKETIEIDTNHCVISGRSFVELYYAGEAIGSGRRCYPYTLGGRQATASISDYEDLLWRLRSSITPEERAIGYYYEKMPIEDKGHVGELDAFHDLVVHRQPIAAGPRQSALATLIALKAIASLHDGGRPIDLRFPELSMRSSALQA